MSASAAVPRWLRISKQKVQKSEEWVTFTKVIFDVVSLHMQENGIRSFNMLSLEEKKVLMLKAITALKTDSSYQDLFAVVSKALDKELSAEIMASGKAKSKPELFSLECLNAIEVILNKWPDANVHFLQCLNATLSIEMRYILWKTQLKNSVVKQEYLQLVKSSPKRLISKLDLEISQKCQGLLQSDPTLKILNEMKTSSSVLRHLLSYHHVRSKSVVGLTETEYLVAVPFVYTSLCPVLKARRSAKHASLTAEALASLVEQFIMFWDNRPDYTKSLENSRSVEVFAEEIVRILNRLDNGLAGVLGDLHAKHFRTTENAVQSAVSDLFLPYVRSFFVSYLPLDTVMFIFDQIIIGHQVGAFDPLPYVCASLLYIHEGELGSCQSWRAAESKFRNLLSNQGFESLQGLFIEFNFNNELRKMLESELSKNVHFPVSTVSSLGKLPPWRHWYSDKLAAYFQSVKAKKDSRSPSLSTLLGPEDDPIHERGEASPLSELKSERDNLIEEIHQMKRELIEARQEIREREMEAAEVKERADDEIERLRRQILYLQRKNTLTPPPLQMASKFGFSEPQYEESDSSSIGSAPPPTEATNPKTPLTTPTPTQASLMAAEEPAAEQQPPSPFKVDPASVMRDLAAQMMQGFNLIAHGSPQEQAVLNPQTKSDLDAVKKAYELAKVQVFKKPISDEEIEKLPEVTRRKVSKQLSDATRAQLLKLKVGKV